MRLYHYPFSSNSRRAALVAVHLGLTLEWVTIDLTKGEQRRPEFLHINPNGVVPVLEDEGFFLTESHAIIQYLASKVPVQTLYPAGGRARADVDRWLFWNAQHFQPAVGIFVWENLVKPMMGLGSADPTQLAEGEEQFERYAPILDAHLADRRWIAGIGLTLADLAVAASLSTAAPANVPLTQYRNLRAWFAGVQALDCWKKTAFDLRGNRVAA